MVVFISFYDRSAPIYTQPRFLPPSKVVDADVTDSVIGEGCLIKVIVIQITWNSCTCPFLMHLYERKKGRDSVIARLNIMFGTQS